MPSDAFERKRTLHSLRRDLDAHPQDTVLLVSLRSALRFGAFASWLPAEVATRLINEAAQYKDFYLHKAFMDDGGNHAPHLSARERLELRLWLDGDGDENSLEPK